MSLKDKIEEGKEVIEQALEQFENPVIGFTGGKDSTLVAWLTKQVCEEQNYEKPTLMFIDHGQHFQEVREFGEELSNEWGYEVLRATNLTLAQREPGEEVNVLELPQSQIDELEEHDFISDAEDNIENSLNTKAGNHMLKTYPMKHFIVSEEVDAVINGIRRDEHESRENEDFFSPREEPEHVRVHPILNFTEQDVWDALWHFAEGVDAENKPENKDYLEETEGFVPVNPLYFEGYRSLGSETQTEKSSDQPAWMQDFEGTTEREGRAQDKDTGDAMAELREKGYM